MATDRVTYITRQLVRPLDSSVQQLRYIQDGREDLVFTQSRNFPQWAANNPAIYFQTAEIYERPQWTAFEEWKITLPQELDHRQNMTLMRDLVDAIAGTTCPITYAFHDPRTLDKSGQQPHLHLLISARQTDGYSRTPAQHFKRYNRAHPGHGGAQKAPTFWHRGAVKASRVLITDIVNLHLERAGYPERVHPDTLLERGIPRTPEPKLLPSQSRIYKEHGTITPRMQEVLSIRTARQQTRADEQANARDYWETRKGTLGITEDMDLPAQLAAIGTARAQVRDHAPAHQGEEQQLRTLGQDAIDDAWRDAVLLWAEDQGMRALHDVGWTALQEARDEAREAVGAGWQVREQQAQHQRWESLADSIAALVRHLDGLSADDGHSGQVPIRLWERDQGQGL